MDQLTNRSAFLYNYVVTNTNNLLPFFDGIVDKLAQLRTGSYTFSGLGVEISRAMNAVGENEYTVLTDRNTRTFTISADNTFNLQVTSIYSESDIYDVIGFTSDKTGSNTYTSDESTGVLFKPQFVLQNYTDFENERISIGGVRNESANGVNIENVKFGSYNVMTCNISYVTENEMGRGNTIENNQNAMQELRDFMNYITDLQPVEFIPDRDAPTVGVSECILNSTRESKSGLDYRIKRVQGSTRHFETGELKFRRI